MITRPPAGSIPDTPGSYQFKDLSGRIIYVGKAKNLRSRIASYFQNPQKLPLRTRQMMEAANTVEWLQVANEVEALMLEYSLIQRHKPRFNVRYTDDKSYPFLCLTMVDEWPRAMVIRGKLKKGNRYFGPYGQAYAIRETLDLLLRTFPIRTCSDSKFNRHSKLGEPCLLFHIEKCAGPCVGEVEKSTYDEMVAELIGFLAGDSDAAINKLSTEMCRASEALEFEKAAYFRDRLGSVRKALEKQQMVFPNRNDVDVIGVFEDELEAAVQVFFVRKGRVMGHRGFIVDKAEELDEPELMARVLERLYFDDNPVGWPKEVLLPCLPNDLGLYEEWISEARGSKVEIRVPQRGDKRKLHKTVTQNAQDSFRRHRLKRGNDHNSRAKALNELQEYLNLPKVPLRIECYDMSHIGGTDYVGSMVVVEDGLPKKADYRRFQVRSVPGNDDFAAMHEVLSRRLSAYLAERDLPVEQRDGRFSYPPQLLVVDGGKGQLGVAKKVLEGFELMEEIPLVALAKQFEEVFAPSQSEPILLPRQSEALYLLQRIRDESHRFAVAYHRQLRNKRMTRSALDGIAGLGPARKKRLTLELGGIKAVKQASLDDLQALTWLPQQIAENVFKHLHRP